MHKAQEICYTTKETKDVRISYLVNCHIIKLQQEEMEYLGSNYHNYFIYILACKASSHIMSENASNISALACF